MSNVTIRVKLTPKAAQNAVQGWEEDHLGEKLLKCAVTAVPEKGKANKCLIDFLVKKLGIKKNDICITSGKTNPVKHIQIDGMSKEIFISKLSLEQY